MKSEYIFQLSKYMRLNERTFHKGCGQPIVEARLFADDLDQQWDSGRCWLLCLGRHVSASEVTAFIPDDFDPVRDADKFCLCISEGLVERYSYWTQDDEQKAISAELFESVPEGGLLPAYDPIYKLVTDPKTGVSSTRPATWDEERAFYRKHTAALLQKWAEKTKMQDAG